ncbi:carbohydrate porin [Paraburkholderia sediminicola]|uniref:carbohydrate porin n=1 Tax=Paraburkholderia sediminicola TaxID=458836 RepID=UPI0038B9A907
MVRTTQLVPVVASLVALAGTFASSGLHAQTSGDQPDNLAQSSPNLPGMLAMPGFSPSCAKYDALSTRANAVMLNTPTCETLFPELGGARAWLADYGIGFSASFAPTYQYDVLGHNHNPQMYGGQDPTWSQSLMPTLTYDLSRIGFSKDSQLTLQGMWQTSDYRNSVPHVGSMTIFAINQRFLNDQLEVQYGYYPLIAQYYGFVLGGNASSAALGPGSVIPFEVGMSSSEPTPGFDITVRDPSLRWYNHFSVARSQSPEGVLPDIDANPSGFRLTVPGARAIFVDEFGYKTQASPTSRSMWFRVGTIYNTSHYTSLETGADTRNNYAVYVAATYQITHPDSSPRGLYADVKLDYAPQDRNLFTKDYQLALYYIGPFKNRPADMVSLGLTQSFFSKTAQNNVSLTGIPAAASSLALSLSYAARVMRGVYSVTGLTYQKNPTFAPTQPNALLFQQSINISF